MRSVITEPLAITENPFNTEPLTENPIVTELNVIGQGGSQAVLEEPIHKSSLKVEKT